MKYIFQVLGLVLLFLCPVRASAQSSYYTLFQVGGQFGLRNPGYEGTFNGYAANFVFGLNFNDRAFVGIGAGNETFRGTYRSNDVIRGREQLQMQYDTYLLPLFVDARMPLTYLSEYSWIGVFGNAGYAPRISPVYDRGALFRGGLFYVYETMRGNNFTISAAYGYQELNRNAINFGSRFQHQHLSLSVGMMLK